MKRIHFKDAAEWREWLKIYHESSPGIWMVFHKKATGKASIDYESAIEEALCFGWIDSIIKKINDEKYARKFTPRSINSVWSDLNKNRVRRLINEARMTEAGLEKVEYAKKIGKWETANKPILNPDMPEKFLAALKKNKKAKDFFDRLAPSYRRQFIVWIAIAKREVTRIKRINESIGLLEKGEKLGLK